MDEYTYEAEPQGRIARVRASFTETALVYLDKILDAAETDFAIIRRDLDLFLGVFLFILGFLGFHSGRYCDGNTADYLSCTRPVTYYYYTWLEMGLIILGVFFILLWFLKRKDR